MYSYKPYNINIGIYIIFTTHTPTQTYKIYREMITHQDEYINYNKYSAVAALTVFSNPQLVTWHSIFSKMKVDCMNNIVYFKTFTSWRRWRVTYNVLNFCGPYKNIKVNVADYSLSSNHTLIQLVSSNCSTVGKWRSDLFQWVYKQLSQASRPPEIKHWLISPSINTFRKIM